MCSTGEGQVHDLDRLCVNGSYAKKLSIVDVDIHGSQNHPMQRENFLFTHGAKWTHVGIYSSTHQHLTPFLETPATLWENGVHSTNGLNDKVPVGIVNGTRQSLYFIKPTKLFIHIGTEGEDFGTPRRKVRARFFYNNVEYMFSLMDTNILDEFNNHQNGEYEISDAYMTVSLAGEHLKHFWKIAAAIIRVGS